VNQRYTISGQVFNDTNRNYTRDNGEGIVAGVTLHLGGAASGTTTSNSSGNYAFGNLLGGGRAYTVTMTVPAGFVNVSGIQYSVTLTNGNAAGRNFAIVNVYTIEGNVFNDINKNRFKDSTNGVAETNISGITMSASGGNLSVDAAAGTYIVTNLLEGAYTISYTSAFPPGYFLIHPRTGPPPQLRLTVGPNCINTIGLSFGARCVNGNIQEADFAISNSIPWHQSYGLDVRIDEGFDDIIPTNPKYPKYASIADADSGAANDAVIPTNTPTPTPIPIPPPPTNVTAGCSAAGTTATVNWTVPSGYSYSYVRLYDESTGATFYPGPGIGSSYSITSTPGHTYSYWVHTTYASGTPYSSEVPTAHTATFTCPNPPPPNEPGEGAGCNAYDSYLGVNHYGTCWDRVSKPCGTYYDSGNFCPGDDSVQCCVTNQQACRSTGRCHNRYSSGWGNAYSCGQTWYSGVCPGPNDVQCCAP